GDIHGPARLAIHGANKNTTVVPDVINTIVWQAPALLIDSAAAGAPQWNGIIIQGIQLRAGAVVKSRGWLPASGTEIRLDRLHPHEIEIRIVVEVLLLQIGENLKQ